MAKSTDFSCQCLNVRLRVVPGSKGLDHSHTQSVVVEEIGVIYPHLTDIILSEAHHFGREFYALLACLGCQMLVYSVSIDPPYVLHFREADGILESPSGCIGGPSVNCLTGANLTNSSYIPSPFLKILTNPGLIKKNFGPEFYAEVPTRQTFEVSESARESFLSELYSRYLASNSGRHVSAADKFSPNFEEFRKQLRSAQECRAEEKDKLQHCPKAAPPRTVGSLLNPLLVSVEKLWRDRRDEISLPLFAFPTPRTTKPRGPNESRQRLSDLPHELFLSVILNLIPYYSTAGQRAERDYAVHLQRYREKRALFAQLALLSRSWQSLITPLLYRQLTIFPSNSLESLNNALQRQGHLVRTIIVDNRGGSRKFTWQEEVAFRIEVTMCISFTPQVLHLEFHHQKHCYDRKSWLKHAVPNLERSLRKLVLHGKGVDRMLPVALLALGRSIEHLTILDWRDDDKDARTSFHLPNEMPRLESLEISGGHLGKEKLEKLLLRVRARHKQIERGKAGNYVSTVPLRTFALLEIEGLTPPFILEALQSNQMYTVLTRLSIKLAPALEFQSASLTLPIELLKRCSRLVHLSFTSPCSPDVLSYLPVQLTSLELMVVSDELPLVDCSYINSTDPLIQYVLSDSLPRLHELSVVHRTRRSLPLIIVMGGGALNEWRRLHLGEDIRLGLHDVTLRKVCEAAGVRLKGSSILEVWKASDEF